MILYFYHTSAKLIATSSSQNEPEVVQARQTISDEDFYSSEETVTRTTRSTSMYFLTDINQSRPENMRFPAETRFYL